MPAAPPGADPFVRRLPTSERVAHLVASVAALWGVGYLGWRCLATMGGTARPAAIVLLAAEIVGTVVFVARMHLAWRTPTALYLVADDQPADTVAVIEATDASIDELRTSLVALRRVEGLRAISIVDTTGSRWLRSVAKRLGADVFDSDVTIDRALCGAAGDWVLYLRAGDLVLPDVLTASAFVCEDPAVAVVQVGVEEADPTSFEHDPTGRWSLDPFERQVVRPSLSGGGVVPWYGDGPTLVRTAALGDIGGLAPGRSRWRRTGYRMTRAGWEIVALPLTLARVRGPRSLGESLARHGEFSRDSISALTGSDGPHGLGGEVAGVALASALLPLASVHRLLQIAAAVLVLGFAQIPLTAAWIDLALIAVPAYMLRWSAQLLLGRGRLGPLSVLRHELRSLGVDLRALLPGVPRGSSHGHLRLLALSTIALDAAVAVAAISIWRDWPSGLPTSVAVVALVTTGAFLGVAMEVMLDALARRQKRAHARIRLGLVTCQLAGQWGQLVDLSTGGAGVVLDVAYDDAPPAGSSTSISFRIPDDRDVWRDVSTTARVVYSALDEHGGVRLGVAFDDPTDLSLDAVVEFLTIDRRMWALRNRFEPVVTDHSGGAS